MMTATAHDAPVSSQSGVLVPRATGRYASSPPAQETDQDQALDVTASAKVQKLLHLDDTVLQGVVAERTLGANAHAVGSKPNVKQTELTSGLAPIEFAEDILRLHPTMADPQPNSAPYARRGHTHQVQDELRDGSLESR